MPDSSSDQAESLKYLLHLANRAGKAQEEVSQRANEVHDNLASVVLDCQDNVARTYVTKSCIRLLALVVCSALFGAIADSTNTGILKEGLLEKVLKVSGMVLPIITLALGYYFGSPPRKP
jgi:hypothetical protein